MPILETCALTAQGNTDLSIAFVIVGSTVELRRLRAAALALPPRTRTAAVICDPAATPGFRLLGDVGVYTIGALGDLPQLLAKGLRS